MAGAGPAHPRSRGENTPARHCTQCAGGSSPLTRGKRVTLLPWQELVRLIPAHAGKTRPRGTARSAPGAHPRSRGENLRGLGAHGLVDGSSPLTRGKLSAEKSVFLTGRLIPAHAGKTAPSGVAGSCMPAHPRSRGENGFSAPRVHDSRGSSPLTRGKPDRRRRRPQRARLIPAHAGKTRRHTRQSEL